MSRSATPATQNDMTTCFETFEKERFCSFERWDETCRSLKTSISCETSSILSIFYTLQLQNRRFPTTTSFPSEPRNLPPQNRCFVRGFRQFSSHISKCNVCHGICTLSPLRGALTMGLATTTQHDTSEVLRWPRKMQLIFCKRCKSIALATKKKIFDTLWNILECHKVPRLPRETKLRDVWNLQNWHKLTTFAELAKGTAIATYLRTVADSYKRLQTVADGCGGRSGVERTHLHPQTPKVKREPFATHSGITAHDSTIHHRKTHSNT